MELHAATINHSEQRYPTVGDWLIVSPSAIDVLVSKMGNTDFEFLVAIHELIEAYLCTARGITEELVSDFDIRFESVRTPGNIDEPGDHPQAPYHKEHVFATKIEKMIANELGVNWEEYDNVVNSL